MKNIWGLVALIGAWQILESAKQLKKYRRNMFSGGLKYGLFVFSNLLNIVSVGLIIYGIFFYSGIILPACALWLFNWHLFTYYAAELKKDGSRTMLIAMRVITGFLVLGCVYISISGL